MIERQSILVTGGAGFIGSAVCRYLVGQGHNVVCVDKLTYAGSLAALQEINCCENYAFVKADVCDEAHMLATMKKYDIGAVLHLAAETHVDRSVDGPTVFAHTNVLGTVSLLSATLSYWQDLGPRSREQFRFLHVSTDEVFGDLGFNTDSCSEEARYVPSSPYSASKAASDHFVRSFAKTYGLPVLLTYSSNNYGPFQFPDKLIPTAIINALDEKPLPIYGTGENVRDWLFVGDHVRGLETVLLVGAVGDSYNIGSRSERTNLSIVTTICTVLDEMRPRRGGWRYADLITHVEDRPGHDGRYALDPDKIEKDLGWRATVSVEKGIPETVGWYVSNEWWWRPIRENDYDGRRLGKASKFPACR